MIKLRQLFFILLAVLSLLLSTQELRAQYFDGNEEAAILFNFNYALQNPGGDLSDRFDRNSNFGIALEYLTKPSSNLIFGLEGQVLFGNNVKENVLVNLLTEEGALIGNDRNYADVRLSQRGFYIGALAGKLFPLSSVNKRSGIRITIGSGLLQHKIRIQGDPVREVPQLSGEYAKGYDRLTNGLALTQFIGYQYLAVNKRVNFYIGIDLTQAFTRSRRDFDFDRMAADTEDRLDLLYGFRIGWTLPFYLAPADEIYY